MPRRRAMKAASFPRQRGCFDAGSNTRARTITARSQRQDRSSSSNGSKSRSNSNVKLQEIKLAFCLLSRELQGLGEGGNNALAEGTTPAVSDGKRCAAAKKKPPPDLVRPSAGPIPPVVTTQGVSQQPHAPGEEKKRDRCLENVNAASCNEERNEIRERSGINPSRTHKGAACNEGRKAAEAAAAGAKEALKHLRVELGAERKSRIAAER